MHISCHIHVVIQFHIFQLSVLLSTGIPNWISIGISDRICGPQIQAVSCFAILICITDRVLSVICGFGWAAIMGCHRDLIESEFISLAQAAAAGSRTGRLCLHGWRARQHPAAGSPRNMPAKRGRGSGLGSCS